MSMLFSPVATELGLQVLLQPYNSSIGRGACLLAGLVYPTYATLKTLDAKSETELDRVRNAAECRRWLKYWTCLGSLSVAEVVLSRAIPWTPYYHALKFAFLLWLQLPRFEGASRLCWELLLPGFRKVSPVAEMVLAQLSAVCNSPALALLEKNVQALAAQIPFLEWLMRRPSLGALS